ncbi:MAG: hypothetical protein V1743_02075 [Nanoarchaeota archaeon]
MSAEPKKLPQEDSIGTLESILCSQEDKEKRLLTQDLRIALIEGVRRDLSPQFRTRILEYYLLTPKQQMLRDVLNPAQSSTFKDFKEFYSFLAENGFARVLTDPSNIKTDNDEGIVDIDDYITRIKKIKHELFSWEREHNIPPPWALGDNLNSLRKKILNVEHSPEFQNDNVKELNKRIKRFQNNQELKKEYTKLLSERGIELHQNKAEIRNHFNHRINSDFILGRMNGVNPSLYLACFDEWARHAFREYVMNRHMTYLQSGENSQVRILLAQTIDSLFSPELPNSLDIQHQTKEKIHWEYIISEVSRKYEHYLRKKIERSIHIIISDIERIPNQAAERAHQYLSAVKELGYDIKIPSSPQPELLRQAYIRWADPLKEKMNTEFAGLLGLP